MRLKLFKNRVPKPSGHGNKKAFSSRTVIGIICIIVALVITFGVAPIINRFSDRKIEVVRVKTDIHRGQMITEDMIETVNVGSYNLPEGIIKEKDLVVGRYAATDMCKGDSFFEGDLATDSKSANDILLSLDGNKVAVSVNINNFACGLSNKLENGDVVSVIIHDDKSEKSHIPAELKYVMVITTTTGSGYDKEEDTAGELSSTVTLLVTPKQAELLAQYNSTTTLPFALIYRGNSEKANEYLKLQDEYLNNSLEEPAGGEENG